MPNGNESILTSVKKYIGATEEYEQFDDTILLLINSELGTLTELGVGSEDDPLVISDKNTMWNELTTDRVLLGLVPEYIALRVRLSFDPPQSSYVAESLKAKGAELEWRIRHRAERIA